MVTVTVVFGGGASVDVAFSAGAPLGASGMGRLADSGALWARLDAQRDGHAATGDLRLELRAEPADGADHRCHRRRAERADRGLAGRERHRGETRFLEGGGRVRTGAD